MTTKTKTATKPKTKKADALTITPINMRSVKLWIQGTSPLIQHAWSEKSLRMLRMTAAERRKVPKTSRNPEEEGGAAAYMCGADRYGVPAMAVKSAMVEAAHKDIGVAKTLVRKALRFRQAGIIPMECSEPVIREDIVRVGQGQTDLRYRPEFAEWRVQVELEYDADTLTLQDVVNLIDRAGFSVGIGEWRPEKDGEFGRFEVDNSRPIEDAPARRPGCKVRVTQNMAGRARRGKAGRGQQLTNHDYGKR